MTDDSVISSVVYELVSFVAYKSVVKQPIDYSQCILSSEPGSELDLSCKCGQCISTNNTSIPHLINKPATLGSPVHFLSISGSSMGPSFAPKTPRSIRFASGVASFAETPLPSIPLDQIPSELTERISDIIHLQIKTVHAENTTRNKKSKKKKKGIN
ncbi:hypothetical protein RCL1_007377 [Eukaryota sp. TZLM3-RCL]